MIGYHGDEHIDNVSLFVSFVLFNVNGAFISQTNPLIFILLRSIFAALNIKMADQSRGDTSSAISGSTNADNRKDGSSSKKGKKKKSKSRKRHSSSSSSSDSSESSDSSSGESSSSSDSSSSSGKFHEPCTQSVSCIFVQSLLHALHPFNGNRISQISSHFILL